MDDITGTHINPNIYKSGDTITFSVNIPNIKDNGEILDEDDDRNPNLINTDTTYYKFTVNSIKYTNDKKAEKPKQPWYVSQINKNHKKR